MVYGGLKDHRTLHIMEMWSTSLLQSWGSKLRFRYSHPMTRSRFRRQPCIEIYAAPQRILRFRTTGSKPTAQRMRDPTDLQNSDSERLENRRLQILHCTAKTYPRWPWGNRYHRSKHRDFARGARWSGRNSPPASLTTATSIWST
jgi:hypothetical protein